MACPCVLAWLRLVAGSGGGRGRSHWKRSPSCVCVPRQAMGCEVVALSRSADKEAMAREMGAHEFVNTRPEDGLASAAKFDFVYAMQSQLQHPSLPACGASLVLS